MIAKNCHSAAVQDDPQAAITAIIARTPEWVRQELLSKEQATRARAEEALAAMIAVALKDAQSA